MDKLAFNQSNRSATVLQQLNRQRIHHDQVCDIILEVEREQYFTHKCLLITMPYFQDMFTDAPTTFIDDDSKQLVKIDDISSYEIEIVLNYLYTGKVTITPKNRLSVLKVSSKMNFEDLRDFVVEYMIKTLKENNCFEFRDLAYQKNFYPLILKTNDFLVEHIVDLSKQKCFLELDCADMRTLLENNDLKVPSEDDAFKLLLRWFEGNPENRKDYFLSLMKLIRLHYVSLKYLKETIAKHDLVKGSPETRQLVEDALLQRLKSFSFSDQKPRTHYAPVDEQPLGMENGKIPDDAITASSIYDANHAPFLGRLNNYKSEIGIGAWVPKVNKGSFLMPANFDSAGSSWLQVKFPSKCIVTAVVTQGRPADYDQYVTSYNIKYSNDGINFIDVGKTFTANQDTSTTVTNHLPNPIIASSVRLYPMSWHIAPTLRMEILGFREVLTPTPVTTSKKYAERPLGIESFEICDSSITASSMWDEGHAPHLGRLNNAKSDKGIGAWVPKKPGTYFSPPGTDWIQVRLPTQCTITAIITQGRPADYNQYVMSYNIKYSNDGSDFVDVGKTFDANRDTNSRVTNRLPKPVAASFVRLYPMSWQEAPTLRMEIMGFANPGQPIAVARSVKKRGRVLLLNENKIFIAANKSWSQLTHVQVRFAQRIVK